jgi:hypothetical protein
MTSTPAQDDTSTTAAAASDNGAAASASPVDIKAMVRGAQRAKKSVAICLRLDLVAEFEALERQLDEATRHPAGGDVDDTRLNQARTTSAAGRDVAERMRALQDEMRAATVTFWLRALPPRQWQALEAAHPPRKGDDGKVLDRDSLMGVNVDTFFRAVVPPSVYEPALDPFDWALLLGEVCSSCGVAEGQPHTDACEGPSGGLSQRQYDELASAAWLLNRVQVDIPFSRVASRMIRGGGPG